MKSHTIKVSGISEELLRQIDQLVEEGHYTGRSEVVREALRRYAENGQSTLRSKDRLLKTIERIRMDPDVQKIDWSKVDDSRDSIYD